MGIWIIDGLVMQHSNNEMRKQHLFIEDGKITKILDGNENIDTGDHQVIHAEGKLVSAGFIDMHVHLRDPGFLHKETIQSGTLSAAKGGFTTVACMPNTRPVIGDVETVNYVLNKAKEEGAVRVLPYGSITVNELGRELTDFEALAEAGVIGFTDDGVGVQNAQMMKHAMARAKKINKPIIAHCEDDSLVKGAPVTEGQFATKHNLKGIPNESEAIHVGRDILLAEATGAHYHVCHVSTKQSVRLIRQAKQLGINVTAEVCPHHLLLSEQDIPGLDANWKMNPPLRSQEDVKAMIEAIEDGTIDMIVTDHAPHSKEEKEQGMELAPFGIVGLETAFPLLYTAFVKSGRWSLSFLLEKMTIAPAKVFELPYGHIQVGSEADITIIDLEEQKQIHPAQFVSKGSNTPFTGWNCNGWPIVTIVAGNIVWSSSTTNKE
ncbi:dihydroorotase [Longirhabdus pacifica]|uniref:dihydroorotase n=1 Tax=Longirhabdus pacifica TaxID=2305227 RepID=UPI00100922C3|nr:dihydroorotase [Longirhabdus pacifica]